VLDILTVHHILKNTAVQDVNKPFVYITDLTSTLIVVLGLVHEKFAGHLNRALAIVLVHLLLN
jgi:hypothetical protein